MQVESKSLTKRFLIFILNITYKYCTSSHKHPGAYSVSKLQGAALLEGSAWKREALISNKELLFIWNLKTNNCK